MMGKVGQGGFDQYLTRVVAASCTSHRLHQQLEHALGSTKVGHRQHVVGMQDYQQGNVGEVMPFR